MNKLYLSLLLLATSTGAFATTMVTNLMDMDIARAIINNNISLATDNANEIDVLQLNVATIAESTDFNADSIYTNSIGIDNNWNRIDSANIAIANAVDYGYGNRFSINTNIIDIAQNTADIAAIMVLLSYEPPTVNFTGNSMVRELGETIAQFPLSFTVNKQMSTRVLSGSYNQDLDYGGDFEGYIQNLGLTSSFTITVTDDRNATASDTITVTFKNRSYVGGSGSEPDALTNAEIIGWDNVSETKTLTDDEITLNDEYLYVAYPARLGELSTFTMVGYPMDPWPYTTKAVTNTSGSAENYYIYQSFNKITGNTSYAFN